MGFIGIGEATMEASTLVGIRVWSAPVLSVFLGMHTEILSAVRYGSTLVTA